MRSLLKNLYNYESMNISFTKPPYYTEYPHPKRNAEILSDIITRKHIKSSKIKKLRLRLDTSNKLVWKINLRSLFDYYDQKKIELSPFYLEDLNPILNHLNKFEDNLEVLNLHFFYFIMNARDLLPFFKAIYSFKKMRSFYFALSETSIDFSSYFELFISEMYKTGFFFHSHGLIFDFCNKSIQYSISGIETNLDPHETIKIFYNHNDQSSKAKVFLNEALVYSSGLAPIFEHKFPTKLVFHETEYEIEDLISGQSYIETERYDISRISRVYSKDPSTITEGICMLFTILNPNLKELHLDFNYFDFTSLNFSSVVDCLALFPRIKTFSLEMIGQNDLFTEDYDKLFQNLDCLEELVNLTMIFNLCKNLANLTSFLLWNKKHILQKINLSFSEVNDFTDISIKNVCEFLNRNKHINHLNLDIQKNGVTAGCSNFMCETLYNLKDLEYCKLDFDLTRLKKEDFNFEPLISNEQLELLCIFNSKQNNVYKKKVVIHPEKNDNQNNKTNIKRTYIKYMEHSKGLILGEDSEIKHPYDENYLEGRIIRVVKNKK